MAKPVGSEIVLYQTEDHQTRIHVRLEAGTVWLTQAQIAELFQTTPQNITIHLNAVYSEGELREAATCKDCLQVRDEGARAVRRSLKHYKLEAILAVGYRVRSPRGTQFRQWATTRLAEYLAKGFVLDDARLKEPGGLDYFDELLARVREIRASEKRFCQKVRDVYATAVDYDVRSEAAQLFFEKVQNKMLWAVTRRTAAELISERSDPSLPNMGLQTWSGGRVRKHDVVVAKNYLQRPEIEELVTGGGGSGHGRPKSPGSPREEAADETETQAVLKRAGDGVAAFSMVRCARHGKRCVYHAVERRLRPTVYVQSSHTKRQAEGRPRPPVTGRQRDSPR